MGVFFFVCGFLEKVGKKEREWVIELGLLLGGVSFCGVGIVGDGGWGCEGEGWVSFRLFKVLCFVCVVGVWWWGVGGVLWVVRCWGWF